MYRKINTEKTHFYPNLGLTLICLLALSSFSLPVTKNHQLMLEIFIILLESLQISSILTKPADRKHFQCIASP